MLKLIHYENNQWVLTDYDFEEKWDYDISNFFGKEVLQDYKNIIDNTISIYEKRNLNVVANLAMFLYKIEDINLIVDDILKIHYSHYHKEVQKYLSLI
jgi:hypothetical protein